MYRLYLDEVGTDTMRRVHLDGYRYLSLTGVVMTIAHARDYLEPTLNLIKAEVFGQDPDSPICFHRTDITQCKGPFEMLKHQNIRDDFDLRILRLMQDCECKVITILADKVWISEQDHWVQQHPYHYIMELMVEKYAQLLKRMSSKGDIMPEARNKPENKELQKQFERCKTNGTRYASADLIRERIPSTKLKFRTKKDNIAGLQLCDLLAHPSHITIRKNLRHDVQLGNFANRVTKILGNMKYDRGFDGKIWGYGIKSIP